LVERPGGSDPGRTERRLWPDDVFVDFENNLNTAVARLREALNDSAESPRFIETLPRHGYRFIGILSKETVPATGPVGHARTRLAGAAVVNTGDSALESFSDVITDDLITGLAALAPGALTVIARTTAMHYKGSRKDVARIGRELNVDHVLEGTVCRSGDALAVNAQLFRVSDQAHVWAQRYEGPPGDLFSIPERGRAGDRRRVGRHTIQAGDRAHRRARKRTRDPIAYKEYVQGRRHLDAFRTSEDVEKAREHFEHAVARDPDFALAREALAELFCLQGYLGLMPPRDAFAAGILPRRPGAGNRRNPRGNARAARPIPQATRIQLAGHRAELGRALDLDPASPVRQLDVM